MGQLLGFVVEDELEALLVVCGVGGVVLGDRVRGAQCFGLVDGSHMLRQRVGAGEGAVAF